jgi:steroid delta-isomerase
MATASLTLVSLQQSGGKVRTDRQQIVKLVDRYLDTLRTGDVDAIMDLYDVDATLEDPVGSTLRKGKAAIREMYAENRQIHLVERVGPVTVWDRHAGFQFRIDLHSQSELAGTDDLLRLVITEIMAFSESGQITSMVAVPDFYVMEAQSE